MGCNRAFYLRMKSILGLAAALLAAAAVAAAYAYSARPGAGWFDAQWLFVIALPYNWTMLKLAGGSNFSPDAPLQIIAALIFNAALAYIAGAFIEALSRWLLSRVARGRSQP